jgi:lysylphosphatidylglycerol synthetase-like protein (DUF2156 family)
MVDGLVKDAKLLGGTSLNLVDRLAFAKSTSTTAKTTTTTTTTTTIHEEVIPLSLFPSSSSDTFVPSAPRLSTPHSQKCGERNVFHLNDFAALAALKELISRYGRVSHMGILDPSYTFFLTTDRRAALYYKLVNSIAVVGGDPLCKPFLFPQILAEFQAYRKKSGWGIAFLGAGETFVNFVQGEKWTTMHFGTECVLNPLTNPVLHGTAAKSITVRNKHLLNPKKKGISVEVYTPRLRKNAKLQKQLVNVYDAWRENRNGSKGAAQAYITVYDPFALPELMTYIYSKDQEGNPNGFAALRMLGANNGYHLDPCIAAPGAPKGITDLLVYSAMALLNKANISYLSIGYEPLDDLGEISGTPKAFAKMSRKVHRRIFDGVGVGGKKEYHDKFRPDKGQESRLFLVFPPGVPSLRQFVAIVHMANIRLRGVVGKGLKEKSRSVFSNRKEEGEGKESKEEGKF